MAVDFPIDKSYLVAGWLAAAFWGAFTVLFIACMYTSFTRANRRWIYLGAIIVMYCLATAHISLILTRLIEAFIDHVHDAEQGATLYLADIAKPINRSKDMIYITTIWLGDTILAWRCFMVWNRDWRVISLPILMIIATAVSGYGAVGQYFLPNPYTFLAVHWAKGMLAVSMATNLILTLLTAGRIWVLAHRINFHVIAGSKTTVRYRTLVLVILETGMLVTVGKFLEFLLFNLAPADGIGGNNALYIIMDCMPQLMGIAPTFIVLAVNQGFMSTGSETYTVNTSWHANSGSTNSASTRGTGDRIMLSVQKSKFDDSYPKHVIASESDRAGDGTSYDSGVKHVV
ncbi:hypothetical protein K474DRAFT_1711331 [Panus rudis PR-1116 ss-1]|nr:hypothetical protein K474DRAFT_1711331 [Panus rudis PR-1116 ss-1]